MGGVAAAGMAALATRALAPCGGRDATGCRHVETYEEFARRVRVGDVILAASSRRPLLAGTCMATGTAWTHAGIVAVVDGGDTLELAASPCNGVSMRQIKDFVVHTGSIWCRHFDGVAGATLARSVERASGALRGRTGFNSDPVSLANCVSPSGMPSFGDAVHGQMGLTCAQTAAIILADAGVLALDRDISRYLPCTFSDAGDAAWKMRPSPVTLVVGWRGLPVDLSKIK